ncbi:hypothetical protein VXM60_02780 [Shewanella khirikhana]|uniref:hypothetical protein n=1 Tax=Shewanella khirikhana TaxID=1965282 RepID=UPI0030D3E865
MQPQREVEGELIGTYRQLLAVIVLMLLLAIVGLRYFGSLDSMASHGMTLEQSRWLNIVSMARSKWLGQGRGDTLKLEWEMLGREKPADPVLVAMSTNGWPQPQTETAVGCLQLWQQLLGNDGKQLVDVGFDYQARACDYFGEAGSQLTYTLDTGKVTLVTQTN